MKSRLSILLCLVLTSSASALVRTGEISPVTTEQFRPSNGQVLTSLNRSVWGAFLGTKNQVTHLGFLNANFGGADMTSYPGNSWTVRQGFSGTDSGHAEHRGGGVRYMDYDNTTGCVYDSGAGRWELYFATGRTAPLTNCGVFPNECHVYDAVPGGTTCTPNDFGGAPSNGHTNNNFVEYSVFPWGGTQSNCFGFSEGGNNQYNIIYQVDINGSTSCSVTQIFGY